MTNGILNSVTNSVLDAWSDDDKGVLVALDFGKFYELEDSLSEEESVVETLEAARVFRGAQTLEAMTGLPVASHEDVSSRFWHRIFLILFLTRHSQLDACLILGLP